jgi:hypothetical protein
MASSPCLRRDFSTGSGGSRGLDITRVLTAAGPSQSPCGEPRDGRRTPPRTLRSGASHHGSRMDALPLIRPPGRRPAGSPDTGRFRRPRVRNLLMPSQSERRHTSCPDAGACPLSASVSERASYRRADQTLLAGREEAHRGAAPRTPVAGSRSWIWRNEDRINCVRKSSAERRALLAARRETPSSWPDVL